jgi:hypothetical protein
MALIVTDEGLKRLLDLLSTGAGLANVRIGLFKNNITPTHSDTLSTYTAADFSGYAVVTPAYAAASVSAHVATMVDAAARNFTHNAGATGNTVYGYYAYDSVGGQSLFAEAFASPQAMVNNGDQIQLTSKFSLTSQY